MPVGHAPAGPHVRLGMRQPLPAQRVLRPTDAWLLDFLGDVVNLDHATLARLAEALRSRPAPRKSAPDVIV
ncbi:hypothetical protein GCM10022255_066840 [Dactylosporangium darangshiense]|uniref:Transposase n=2 Tax=Dactylosporangium darangshiense TaxID=579108 RepID=A0ABP8DH94_9ACTN